MGSIAAGVAICNAVNTFFAICFKVLGTLTCSRIYWCFLAVVVDVAPVGSGGTDAPSKSGVVNCIQGTLGAHSLELELIALTCQTATAAGFVGITR